MARIQVRVSPNARRSEVVGPYGEGWKVRVAAVPENGKANAELERFLCEVLGVRDVRVVGGASSQSKVVEAEGVTLDEARAAFERAST